MTMRGMDADTAVEEILTNWWLNEEDVSWYIQEMYWKNREFFEELVVLLEEEGFILFHKSYNPSKR